ncbi:MAG: metallophosphoesterase [Leadbetterella sp.]|nr:metallophosphoesterase [Leadbetterella sp.]
MKKITLLLLLLSAGLGVNGQSLRIGLIADIQYADKPDKGTRFYRTSLQKLDESVSALNEAQVDFTVVLGDLVDEGPKDLPPVMQRLKQSRAPVYNLLGNHDYVSVKDPGSLYRALEMPAPYYTVDRAGWRFIFLNTNELSSYATVPGSRPAAEFKLMEEQLTKEGRPKVLPWNGGIGKAQMKWLERQLRTAAKKDLKVLVFMHHPLLPDNNAHEALNNLDILNLLLKYKQVKAAISGHNHAGAFVMHQGLPCITLEGMVETADRNAYGTLTIEDNKLTISGNGRLSSRVITF